MATNTFPISSFGAGNVSDSMTGFDPNTGMGQTYGGQMTGQTFDPTSGAITVAKDAAAGSIVPGIGTAIGAAVGLGQAALQWYDDTQNRKAQQSAQAQQLQLYNQAQAEDTRRYNAQLNMSQVNQQDQLKNSAQNRQLNQQNMNLKQEQSQETMMANYINRLMGFANSPSTRGIFNGLWGKK